MKLFSKIFFIICLTFIAACSKSDNDQETPPAEQEFSGEVSLLVSKAQITADGADICKFTVKADNEDVTDKADVYLEGETSYPLSSKEFKTDKEGEYKFFAVFKKKNSNTIAVNAVRQEEDPEDEPEPEQDINALPEDPQPENYSFHRNVMALQFTGIGCSNCPSVYQAIINLKANYKETADKVVFAAVHSYNKNVPDPMYSALTEELALLHDIKWAPDMRCNLIKGKQGQYDIKSANGLKDMIDFYHSNELAKVGISASVINDNNTIKVKISVKAAEEGKYRYGVILLEDGIYAVQKGTSNTDLYTHNNVVRKLFGRRSSSDFSGADIELKAKETKIVETPLALEEGWNAEKCKVLIYVTDKTSGYTVNNVAVCKVNEKLNFRYSN